MKQLIIIDDHKMICQGIKSMVETKDGWNVLFCASSFKETFDELEKHKADFNQTVCALIDVCLGDENGLDLAKELTQKGIHCVMYSMFKSPSYVLKAMEIGAYGYVLKDQNEQDIMQALNVAYVEQKFMSYELMDSANNLLKIIMSFTKKEKDVFEGAIHDLSVNEISEKLGITRRTVENHLSVIYAKTGCNSREELRKRFG